MKYEVSEWWKSFTSQEAEACLKDAPEDSLLILEGRKRVITFSYVKGMADAMIIPAECSTLKRSS
jgi:hypothetical protein